MVEKEATLTSLDLVNKIYVVSILLIFCFFRFISLFFGSHRFYIELDSTANQMR